jgi:hypothetical protein
VLAQHGGNVEVVRTGGKGETEDGLAGPAGPIAPGLRADLLLVAGDPTTDIRATSAIVDVWRRGVRQERP